MIINKPFLLWVKVEVSYFTCNGELWDERERVGGGGVMWMTIEMDIILHQNFVDLIKRRVTPIETYTGVRLQGITDDRIVWLGQ